MQTATYKGGREYKKSDIKNWQSKNDSQKKNASQSTGSTYVTNFPALQCTQHMSQSKALKSKPY